MAGETEIRRYEFTFTGHRPSSHNKFTLRHPHDCQMSLMNIEYGLTRAFFEYFPIVFRV